LSYPPLWLAEHIRCADEALRATYADGGGAVAGHIVGY